MRKRNITSCLFILLGFILPLKAQKTVQDFHKFRELKYLNEMGTQSIHLDDPLYKDDPEIMDFRNNKIGNQRNPFIFQSDKVEVSWMSEYASEKVPGRDEARAMAIDGEGNVYVAGFSTKLPYGTDCLIIKYNIRGEQMWTVRYNGNGYRENIANALVVDDSGNVYITGTSEVPETGFDAVTMKCNSDGIKQWIAQYNGPKNQDDYASGMTIDNGGNIYVTGMTENGSKDFFIIKYNSEGEEEWLAIANEQEGFQYYSVGIVVDHVGNVSIAGDHDHDYLTIQYDQEGNERWRRLYNGSGNGIDIPRAIDIDHSGNVYVTGSSRGIDTDEDFATVKYGQDGSQQWVARYDGLDPSGDFAEDLVVDHDGAVYVTGKSYTSDTFGDILTIKYNRSGQVQWIDRYDGTASQEDRPIAITVDDHKNVYVIGRENRSASDYVTIKYDSSGTRQWVSNYPGEGNRCAIPMDLSVDDLGNVFVTGNSEEKDCDVTTIMYSRNGAQHWLAHYDGPGSSNEKGVDIGIDKWGNSYVVGLATLNDDNWDFITLKYDSEGNQKWAAQFNGPVNGRDFPTAMKVDPDGNVYITGSSEGLIYESDYLTMKYNSNGIRQWTARYVGTTSDYHYNEPVAIDIDRQGNVYVSGSSAIDNSGLNPDFTTIKYNPEGVEQWVARYNGPANSVDEVTDMVVDDLGNVHITGRSIGIQPSAENISNAKMDIVTIKYGPKGNQRWQARYNGTSNSKDFPETMAIDKIGNVYVAGISWNMDNHYDAVLMKYNPYGEKQWVACYQSQENNSDFIDDLAVDVTGEIYVIVSTVYLNTHLIKYTSDGDQEWIIPVYDNVNSINLDEFGNIYLSSLNYCDQHFVAKYNPEGEKQWEIYNDDASCSGTAVDFHGNITITGWKSGNGWNIIKTMKYVQTSMQAQIPDDFSLSQNYPNPFYYATNIRYEVPKTGKVILKIYNLLGQEVATLTDSEHTPGIYHVSWGGEDVPSGVYIYRLRGENFSIFKKLLLIK